MHDGLAISRRSSQGAFIVALLVSLLTVSILAGCGTDSPEGAVSKYLNALQGGNWTAFKTTVVPQNFTKDQDALAKDKFDQLKVKFQDVETKTTYDKNDKNKATVVMTSGKVTTTAKILGKEKTETVDIKTLEEPERTYDTVRIKNVWLVDTKL